MRRPSHHRGEMQEHAVLPDLVERCRAGDREAWDRLVQTTYREVYTLCLRILGDPDEAADATQDAYLKVWRGLAGFRGDAMFSTWLYRVAANAALSRHRSRRRRRGHETEAQDDVLWQIPAPRSTESDAQARADVRSVEAALNRLPEHYRLAVALRDIYELPIADVAEQLGITETAAKVRVHRGRRRLKELLSPDAQGE